MISKIKASILYLAAVLAPSLSAAPYTVEFGTNFFGSDYKNFTLESHQNYLTCAEACLKETRCEAYTYVYPNVQGPKARCWLKHSIPGRSTNGSTISGVIKTVNTDRIDQDNSVAHQPDLGSTNIAVLDLEDLVTVCAESPHSMSINTDYFNRIYPTCEEIVKKMGFKHKVTCKVNANGTYKSIGTIGSPETECTTKQIPIYETKCKNVCNVRGPNGVCYEPDQICKKEIVRYKSKTECTGYESSYAVHVDFVNAEPINDTQYKIGVQVTEFWKYRMKPGDLGTYKAERSAAYERKYRTLDNIKSKVYYQLSCNGKNVQGRFNASYSTQSEFTYETISRTCGTERLYLNANRPLYFDGGRIDFDFTARLDRC